MCDEKSKVKIQKSKRVSSGLTDIGELSAPHKLSRHTPIVQKNVFTDKLKLSDFILEGMYCNEA